MDILDPLSESAKVELNEEIIISKIKSNPMDSDDDQGSIEHLAPQTLLETSDADVHYSLRSPEGSMITYRVLQVQEGADNPDFTTSGTTYSTASSTLPQVISGSNLNGQIYVIGNPEAYSTTAGTRPIAPRSSVLDNSVVVVGGKRDERRRATHNEVERRRRDKINNWIAKLAKILPENSANSKGNGQYDGNSKGGILAKAFEYIIELQASETRLGSYMKENKKLANVVDQLRTKNISLESENTELKELLTKHGIEYDGRS